MARIRQLALFLALMLFSLPFPAAAQETGGLPLQAAFVRDGQLWLKIGNQEKQLTKEGQVTYPQWSHDGRWISYVKNGHLWVYDRTQRESYQVTTQDREIRNMQWGPNQNILAFQAGTTDLLMVNLQGSNPSRKLQYVSTDVSQYSWLPDGSGFLTSSDAVPVEDGWSRPALYKIPLGSIGNGGINGSMRFFTLPGMVSKGSVEILSIGTSTFKWSPDGKWIAFLVTPTASWSADSNMLCVLSADGKRFEALDEMVNNDQWFAWAPHKSAALGYIAGSGRFALTNKTLKVQDVASWHSVTVTPKTYADIAFTWHPGGRLTISRAEESTEFTQPEKRTKPALYQANLIDATPDQISTPPAGFGDYSPRFVKRSQKLSWVRANAEQSSVWIANENGTEPREWITNLDAGLNYYEQRNYQNVLSIYGAKR